ncbi:cytochrome d ubiquinol oxidase subunit II [Sesbania bispinosa]|nr:cytochrome d ubiquinol oxidase subunit II [Sesbania bispinosa]
MGTLPPQKLSGFELINNCVFLVHWGDNDRRPGRRSRSTQIPLLPLLIMGLLAPRLVPQLRSKDHGGRAVVGTRSITRSPCKRKLHHLCCDRGDVLP